MFLVLDLCFYLGVFVLYVAKSCCGSLTQQFRGVGPGDFFSRAEGWIGLATVAAFCALIWAQIHFHPGMVHSLTRFLERS